MSTENTLIKSQEYNQEQNNSTPETLSVSESSIEAKNKIESSFNSFTNNGSSLLENSKDYPGAEESDSEKMSDVVSDANKKAEELKDELEQKINELTTEIQETKQEYPENNIMNPAMLDKICQLEAISSLTGEFSQERYDEYMAGQAKLGSYSVGKNQEKIQKELNKGKTLLEALKRVGYELQIIYGQGGFNRYGIDPNTGEMSLLRAGDIASGGDEYKTALTSKAKEFGFNVGLLGS